MFHLESSMCNCEEILPLLSPYLDECLSVEEADRVRAHVAGCRKCADELATLRVTVEMLRGMPMAPVPRSFTISPSMLPAPSGWFYILRSATAAAAASLVAVLILIAALPDVSAPPSPSLVAPTAQHMAKPAKAVETPVVKVSGKGAIAPGDATPAQVASPTTLPERSLAVQPASAPPEDSLPETRGPEPTPSPVPNLSPREKVLVAQAERSALPLREIGYGLLSLLVALSGATFVVWRRGR